MLTNEESAMHEDAGASVSPAMPEPRDFMVVGIYEDGQRFAESYFCHTAEDAEQLAIMQYDCDGEAGLEVAGVVVLDEHGKMEVVR